LKKIIKFDLPDGVEISDIKITLFQESDTWQSDELGQVLEIETVPSEGSSYLILRTDRWAMNLEDISKLGNLIEALCKAIETKEK
jgi:hypothetical protein